MTRVGVMGLGYVGLPLAVQMCLADFEVIGVDIDKERVDTLISGKSYISDVSDETIYNLIDAGRFAATVDFNELKKTDAIIICVPTPLRKTKDPDISYVVNASKQVADCLKPGHIVVLESTVFPGATVEVVAPLLEKSGLKAGEDFYLAFSPERIDPGNNQFKVGDIPKLVGGINPVSTTKTRELYDKVFAATIPLSSSTEAEMAKLLENTFRAVNIGLINELAILANSMGVNLWRVIEAASTKPFGFMPFYPGPGWGGHCIPVDPVYLSWKAKANGGETGFIDHAVLVNNRMPTYVVQRITELLNDHGRSVKGSKILLLGVGYKKDVPDARESPALTILSILEAKGASVGYHDPYLPRVGNGTTWESSSLDRQLLERQDCVVITTDHSCFDYDFVASNTNLVFDTRNATKFVQSQYSNIHVL